MSDDGQTVFRFDLREANGALGDIRTLLPLTIGTIAIAGLSAQAVLPGFGLVCIATGLIDRIARLVPQSVLSGLQLGLGLALAWIALGLMQDQWVIGGLTLGVACGALRFGAHAEPLATGLPEDLRSGALSAIPTATLGALLLIAAAELAFSRRLIDALPSCRPVIAATALGTVLVNQLALLLVGTLAETIRKRAVSRRSHSHRESILPGALPRRRS